MQADRNVCPTLTVQKFPQNEIRDSQMAITALVSPFRRQENDTGRDECLPHPRGRFLGVQALA